WVHHDPWTRAQQPLGRRARRLRVASPGTRGRACARPSSPDWRGDRLLRGPIAGNSRVRPTLWPLGDPVSAHLELASDLELSGRRLRLRLLPADLFQVMGPIGAAPPG